MRDCYMVFTLLTITCILYMALPGRQSSIIWWCFRWAQRCFPSRALQPTQAQPQTCFKSLSVSDPLSCLPLFGASSI